MNRKVSLCNVFAMIKFRESFPLYCIFKYRQFDISSLFKAKMHRKVGLVVRLEFDWKNIQRTYLEYFISVNDRRHYRFYLHFNFFLFSHSAYTTESSLSTYYFLGKCINYKMLNVMWIRMRQTNSNFKLLTLRAGKVGEVIQETIMTMSAVSRDVNQIIHTFYVYSPNEQISTLSDIVSKCFVKGHEMRSTRSLTSSEKYNFSAFSLISLDTVLVFPFLPFTFSEL